MPAQLQALQKQVEQLRQEASVQRIMVSQAIEEMVKYINDNSQADVLVLGINQHENPFRDQKGCNIL